MNQHKLPSMSLQLVPLARGHHLVPFTQQPYLVLNFFCLLTFNEREEALHFSVSFSHKPVCVSSMKCVPGMPATKLKVRLASARDGARMAVPGKTVGGIGNTLQWAT